jgi:hypothetical protein
MTRPSSEAFSDWVDPATSESNKRNVVVLPHVKPGTDVYFDIQNGNLYVIEENMVKVLTRIPQLKNYSYNIKSAAGLNGLKNIKNNSMAVSNSAWIYQEDKWDRYIIYSATGKNTRLAIVHNDSGKIKQTTFAFGSALMPIDLSDRKLYPAIEGIKGSKPDQPEPNIRLVCPFGDGFRNVKSVDKIEGATTFVTWADGSKSTTIKTNELRRLLNSEKEPDYFYLGEPVFIENREDTPGDTQYYYGYITKIHNDDTYDVNYYQTYINPKNLGKIKKTKLSASIIFSEII